MAVRADEALGSANAPHDFRLDLEPGATLAAEAPWPVAEVISSSVAPVRRLVYQTLLLRCARPGEPDAPAEIVVLGRLVAELENGVEVEILRDALPADASDPAVDLSTCGACGGPIVAGEARVEDGVAYHARCWSDGDGD